jgi:hypothetical protein
MKCGADGNFTNMFRGDGKYQIHLELTLFLSLSLSVSLSLSLSLSLSARIQCKWCSLPLVGDSRIFAFAVLMCAIRFS